MAHVILLVGLKYRLDTVNYEYEEEEGGGAGGECVSTLGRANLCEFDSIGSLAQPENSCSRRILHYANKVVTICLTFIKIRDTGEACGEPSTSSLDECR